MDSHLTRREWKSLIRGCLESGQSTERCQILKKRSKGRGLLMRLRVSNESSVIVKAWLSKCLMEHFKRIVGVSNARREWRVHRHVERSGLAVPRPLKFLCVKCSDGRRFETLVVEDLGDMTNGLVYLKGLVQQGDEDGIRRFEDQIVAMTGWLMTARIVDVDHQLRNIVVNGSNRPVRIDFECAMQCRWRKVSPEIYGRMLARLVCSHVYACQPELERTEAFAERLCGHLRPPQDALRVAERRIEQQLDRQKRTKGVESRLRMAW